LNSKCNCIISLSHFSKDDFKVFMPETNACFSEGTLANFRSRYGHSQASFKVEKSYNYGYALLRFTLHSYVIALAMSYLNFGPNSPDKIPEHLRALQADSVALKKKLDDIVGKIFDFGWRDILRSVKQKK
jgi:hypothetical protein